MDANTADPAGLHALGMPDSGIQALVVQRNVKPLDAGKLGEMMQLFGVAGPMLRLEGNSIVTIRATGRVRFVPILSGSMSPAMQPGSAAIATREPIGEVRPGQIIVYTIPVGDRHVSAHRVVEVDASSTRTVTHISTCRPTGAATHRALACSSRRSRSSH